MSRRRKIAVASDEKENVLQPSTNNTESDATSFSIDTAQNALEQLSRQQIGIIFSIMAKIQLNETHHNKYLRELKQLYFKINHKVFFNLFVKIIIRTIAEEEQNEYANTAMLFYAKFIANLELEQSGLFLKDISNWLLGIVSNSPHIRFRLCQFVNMILNALGPEATLDDTICDDILAYMFDRLTDVSALVRVQAVMAMQRLQVPDNPNDSVLRCYQYHLCSDPSAKVRQKIVSCMSRNYHTIPYILDRLWDIDEKVRRHTYLHMSSLPVRTYKVSQRLTILEQGLNERSESVRKVVVNVLLRQWTEAYHKDYIALINALKLDNNEKEINRFRKISQQTLEEIFKTQKSNDLISCLILETEGEFYRCIPHEKLTLENTFYWKCLIEHFQNQMADELDTIIPELSVFCKYVQVFCTLKDTTEGKRFQALEFQYIQLALIEILYLYDLGDEVGRGNVQKLLKDLLRNCTINQRSVEVVTKCIENINTDLHDRHQFLVEIVQDICGLNTERNDLLNIRNSVNELLANSNDTALNLKLSSLKVKILDLEEQEMIHVQRKDYAKVQQILEEKNVATEEFTQLLKPLLEKRAAAANSSSDSLQLPFTNVIKNELVLRGLQITFYLIASTPDKQSLSHTTYRLYNDFISRYIASNEIDIRCWALKCGAAFSMLYEPIAKSVYCELFSQFFRNHNSRIWEISINCMMELLDYYGVEKFSNANETTITTTATTTTIDDPEKSKRIGRQLYKTLEFMDDEDDRVRESGTSFGEGIGIIYMMTHFFDTCEDAVVVQAIVKGFCCLILHGRINNREIVERFLLRYFNPSNKSEINQMLGVFFNRLIGQTNKDILFPCMVKAVNNIFKASYDSSLHDIPPESIARFIIDSTSSDVMSHVKLAKVFMEAMLNNATHKDTCIFLSKELLNLNLLRIPNGDAKNELKMLADKLIKNKLEPKTVKNVVGFKGMLDGIHTNRKLDEEGADDSESTMDTNDKDSDTISVITRHEQMEAIVEETLTNEDQDQEQEQEQEQELEPGPEPEPELEQEEDSNEENQLSSTEEAMKQTREETMNRDKPVTHLRKSFLANNSKITIPSNEILDPRIRRCVVRLKKKFDVASYRKRAENKENPTKKLESVLSASQSKRYNLRVSSSNRLESAETTKLANGKDNTSARKKSTMEETTKRTRLKSSMQQNQRTTTTTNNHNKNKTTKLIRMTKMNKMSKEIKETKETKEIKQLEKDKLMDSDIIPASPDLTVSDMTRNNISNNGGYLPQRVLRRRLNQSGGKNFETLPLLSIDDGILLRNGRKRSLGEEELPEKEVESDRYIITNTSSIRRPARTKLLVSKIPRKIVEQQQQQKQQLNSGKNIIGGGITRKKELSTANVQITRTGLRRRDKRVLLASTILGKRRHDDVSSRKRDGVVNAVLLKRKLEHNTKEGVGTMAKKNLLLKDLMLSGMIMTRQRCSLSDEEMTMTEQQIRRSMVKMVSVGQKKSRIPISLKSKENRFKSSARIV